MKNLKKYWVDLHFRPAQTPILSFQRPFSDGMDLRIDDHHTLFQGHFNAIVAPVETILLCLNDNLTLQRYTVLFICSNFTRLLNGINRTSGNFSIQRPFTAHQLMTVLRENTSSIVFVEHDASMYDEAGETRKWITQSMKQVSRDALFILYTPSMDKHFAYLCRGADRVIVYDYPHTTGVPSYFQKPKREMQCTLC